jgi:hypothetical protein
MSAPATERSNQPISLLPAIGADKRGPEAEKPERPSPAVHGETKFAAVALTLALILSALWAGAVGAYLWGYFGPKGLISLDLQEMAIFAIATFVPPLLFMAVAWTLVRGQAMAAAARAFEESADRLFAADETVARTSARLARAVRHEIDALNSGLDAAFARMRALENVLETQVASLDEAGARIDVRGEALSARLSQERQRIEGVTEAMSETATKASETVAGRAAQLKSTIEAAENSLKTAGATLETQAADFRQAANMAAEAPLAAAVELDKQVKRIEGVADSTMARSEFVLGRHERHRAAMNDMLGRLKEEGLVFETALSGEREAIERAISALGGETTKYETIAADTERRIDGMLEGAAARAAQMAEAYAREAERLRQTGEAAANALTVLTKTLSEAGASAQMLISDTAGKARNDAKALVGSAMEECNRLMQTASTLAAQSEATRTSLNKSIEDVRQHLVTLPDFAKEEAQKVREMVRRETEEMLDLSARTMSTLHARSAPKAPPRPAPATPAEAEAEGLRAMARKLVTQKPQKRKDGEAKSWPMRALLDAADGGEAAPKAPPPKPTAKLALSTLQSALADMAVDLDAIVPDAGPGEAEWKKYLAGDRGVFVRRLADAIDGETMHRVATIYRENARFRDCANLYMEEFEALLATAREGDGSGLLASTVLTADTGKVYLAMAYALGRL